MPRTLAFALLGLALILGCLAYWGVSSSQGAQFFGSTTTPLYLGYAAGGLVACAVISSELAKVRF